MEPAAMIFQLANNQNADSMASRMRAARFALFERLLRDVPRPISICDVGGTADFWRRMDLAADDDVRITIVNLGSQPEVGDRFCCVVADARALPFASESFDVAFSNSVIEHVGTISDQQAMAGEVLRVGKRHFVQTPSYFFPIEPHFLVPGFQYLPVNVRAWMLTKRRLGWVSREFEFDAARRAVESVRLLRLAEFQRLFPHSTIFHERIFGITKSFVAYGGW
jgi:hypothetical protein